MNTIAFMHTYLSACGTVMSYIYLQDGIYQGCWYSVTPGNTCTSIVLNKYKSY